MDIAEALGAAESILLQTHDRPTDECARQTIIAFLKALEPTKAMQDAWFESGYAVIGHPADTDWAAMRDALVEELEKA